MTGPVNQGYGVVSPGGGYGDNNHYASPAISPGNWNVVSPNSSVYSSQGSVNSNVSPANPAASPASSQSRASGSRSGSVPSGTPSSVSSRSTRSANSARSPLSLPTKLGKSSLDIRRENVAGAKALALMHENFGACSDVVKTSVRTSSVQSGARTIRVKREKMATSTRKKNLPTEEEDFETINDFKEYYDLERENEAEKRAVALIRYNLPGFA